MIRPVYKQETEMARKALQAALKAGASQARISLNIGVQNSFSVLENRLDRLQMANDRSLYIQLFVNGRYGAYSTNRLEETEVEKFIRNAVSAVKRLSPDSCHTLPPSELYFKGPGKDLGQFDPYILEMDPAKKKELAFAAFEEIAGKDHRIISVDSEYGDTLEYQYMIDSQGFEGDSLQSGFTLSVECSVKGKGDARPEGWWYESSLTYADFHPAGCGRTALGRASAKLDPVKIASGKYNAIVENTCSSRLFAPIITALNGANIQQQNSFLAGTLGKKVFPEKLTVTDTPHVYGMAGSRYFDGEGIATRPMNIIEQGTINTYFLPTYYANKMETAPTVEGPSVPRITAGSPDESSAGPTLEQMIRQMNDGILITGFNGGNCNGTTGDFSYGIEGFRIENGEIRFPVKEMNITGNIVSLWNNLSLAGNDPRKCSRWQIPSLAFGEVDFSGL